MKRKLNLAVLNNLGIRVLSNMIVGEYGEFTSGDLLDANATKELIDNSPSELDGYINVDGELYKIKDEKAYPISHPDVSTQASILPQRFGNLDMKEILVVPGRESDIPDNATVVSAWSFNENECISAYVKKTPIYNIAHHITGYKQVSSDKWKVELDFPFTRQNLECFTIILNISGELLECRITENYLIVEKQTPILLLGHVEQVSFDPNCFIIVINYTANKSIQNITYSDGVTKLAGYDFNISNYKNVVPDFTLIQYIENYRGSDQDYYYYAANSNS